MRWRALLLDVGQTLLHPREPVGRTYARIAAAHGVIRDPVQAEARFRAALRRRPAGRGQLRYQGDGRAFWRAVVAEATGSTDPALFEELYSWYRQPEAWRIGEGAVDALRALRAAGVGVALVSDWDLRLRPLLRDLALLGEVDHVAISTEVGAEKPDPAIFLAALEGLGVPPAAAVHVGDDPVRDVRGARLLGMEAWAWGVDVRSYAEVQARILGA